MAARSVSADEAHALLAMLGLLEPAPKPGTRGPYGTQGCGSRAGYQRHKERGESACTPCEDAQRDYMRDYQRIHYSAKRRRAAYERAKARGYYAKEAS
ncbi:MAG: hypothetical protein HOV66_07895 [Streptomycetaceae bacterium]|nr:hypothetical protein [Streptomycetaceae bacterium]NUS54771.1 hypothetical protein [Streptomycetaceae bacterium]